MRDSILGMEVIAYDHVGHPVVRDLAKRSYVFMEETGKLVPLHPNPCPARKESKWDTFWYNPIGQVEKKP